MELLPYYPDKGIMIKNNKYYIKNTCFIISKANTVNDSFLIWYLLIVYDICMQQNVFYDYVFSLILFFYQTSFH